jgi:hypothetical protein
VPTNKKDKEEEHRNPLMQDTRTGFAAAPGWTAPPVEETPPQTQQTALPSRPIQTPVELPPAPQARRVTRKMRFTDLYETRSLSIDKRLLDAFDDLMESGPNKTVVANQWVLKILLDAGYQIDPQILTKPVIKPE